MWQRPLKPSHPQPVYMKCCLREIIQWGGVAWKSLGRFFQRSPCQVLVLCSVIQLKLQWLQKLSATFLSSRQPPSKYLLPMTSRSRKKGNRLMETFITFGNFKYLPCPSYYKLYPSYKLHAVNQCRTVLLLTSTFLCLILPVTPNLVLRNWEGGRKKSTECGELALFGELHYLYFLNNERKICFSWNDLYGNWILHDWKLRHLYCFRCFFFIRQLILSPLGTVFETISHNKEERLGPVSNEEMGKKRPSPEILRKHHKETKNDLHSFLMGRRRLIHRRETEVKEKTYPSSDEI